MKKDEELVKVWYYVDRTVKNYDNAEMTPGLRRLVPEWYDNGTGQVNLRPTSRDLNPSNLMKRMDSSRRVILILCLLVLQCTPMGKSPMCRSRK